MLCLISLQAKGFSMENTPRQESSFEKAWSFYMQEQWDSAIYHFHQVKNKEDNKALSHFYLSKIYLKNNYLNEAYTQIKLAIKKEGKYKKDYWELKIETEEHLGQYKALKKSLYYLVEQEGAQAFYLSKLLLSYDRGSFTKKDQQFLLDRLPFEDNILNVRVLSVLVEAGQHEKLMEVIEFLIGKNPHEVHYYFLKHSLLEHMEEKEAAYECLRNMFVLFPNYTEVVNSYFLHTIKNDDDVAALEIFKHLFENRVTLKQIYLLWDYILLNESLTKKWHLVYIHSLEASFDEYYAQQHDYKLADYLIKAFRMGFTSSYLMGMPVYLNLFPEDLMHRKFYLSVLEEKGDPHFESALFEAVAYFPKEWEFYEWAIDYYEKQGMDAEAKEMKEAYRYERSENSN